MPVTLRLAALTAAAVAAAVQLAAAADAAIAPSNTTVSEQYFPGTLPLQDVLSGANIAQVVPLTPEAAQRSIEGNLVRTNDSTAAAADGDVAYLSCDPADYAGFISPQQLLANTNNKANLSAALLYSTTADYCAYEPPADGALARLPVYSMTTRVAAAQLLAAVDSNHYFVRVRPRASDGNPMSTQQQNPLGPSPSTAVAMIILYSITGIITALFLVIILTGAVRAHRHPERYGPRNVLGRPRQSRARGLGRAILDTIPIVKFGEKEPAKPTDVELASTADTADSPAADTASLHHPPAAAALPTVPPPAVVADHPADSPPPPLPAAPAISPPSATPAASSDQPSGIAPAQPVAATSPNSDSTPADDTLGCTICTEDFEKGQDIRVLPCDHKFHPECVDPWLLNVSGTCPLCRVDLRPTISRDSTASEDLELAPPLNPDAEPSQRRRGALRDILSLRQRPNASPEERISALRRLREQRHNQSRDAVEASADQPDDHLARSNRRSRRFSARLSDVFSTRPRRSEPDEPSSQQPSNSQTRT